MRSSQASRRSRALWSRSVALRRPRRFERVSRSPPDEEVPVVPSHPVKGLACDRAITSVAGSFAANACRVRHDDLGLPWTGPRAERFERRELAPRDAAPRAKLALHGVRPPFAKRDEVDPHVAAPERERGERLLRSLREEQHAIEAARAQILAAEDFPRVSHAFAMHLGVVDAARTRPVCAPSSRQKAANREGSPAPPGAPRARRAAWWTRPSASREEDTPDMVTRQSVFFSVLFCPLLAQKARPSANAWLGRLVGPFRAARGRPRTTSPGEPQPRAARGEGGKRRRAQQEGLGRGRGNPSGPGRSTRSPLRQVRATSFPQKCERGTSCALWGFGGGGRGQMVGRHHPLIAFCEVRSWAACPRFWRTSSLCAATRWSCVDDFAKVDSRPRSAIPAQRVRRGS